MIFFRIFQPAERRDRCVCVYCARIEDQTAKARGCHKVALINEFDVKCDTGR